MLRKSKPAVQRAAKKSGLRLQHGREQHQGLPQAPVQTQNPPPSKRARSSSAPSKTIAAAAAAAAATRKRKAQQAQSGDTHSGSAQQPELRSVSREKPSDTDVKGPSSGKVHTSAEAVTKRLCRSESPVVAQSPAAASTPDASSSADGGSSASRVLSSKPVEERAPARQVAKPSLQSSLSGAAATMGATGSVPAAEGAPTPEQFELARQRRVDVSKAGLHQEFMKVYQQRLAKADFSEVSAFHGFVGLLHGLDRGCPRAKSKRGGIFDVL